MSRFCFLLLMRVPEKLPILAEAHVEADPLKSEYGPIPTI